MTHPPFEWILVDSSTVAAIGYHAPSQTLGVRFKSGSVVYTYPNVTQSQWEAYRDAPSKGSHHAAHYRKRTDFTKHNPAPS